MAMAERFADATWEGDLGHGRGTVEAKSGAFGPLDVTWASRTERSEGLTSPEELIAAAHASCFAMALSHGLAEDGHEAERVEVQAKVTLDDVGNGPQVTASHLTVRGRVPGLDADGFRAAAEAAKDGCPVSGALKGNLELSVDAELEEA
jgi:osmotically inducible protein OsmC